MSTAADCSAEFLKFARDLGYEINDLKTDGKIHRFQYGSRKNGWYVAHLNFSARFHRYFIYARLGDWKTGESHEFRSREMESDRHKRREVRIAVEAQRLLAAEEKVAKQREAAERAREIFALAHPDPFRIPDYLYRKKIMGMFGARWDYGQMAILVPMYDQRELCGLQKIFSDGKKLFISGQKSKGAYALIGRIDETSENFMCEGFATGCSIHMATGKGVVVTFSASNLVWVAQILKKFEMRMIVCADNDQFTDGNPGVKFARDAAKILGARVVVPQFKNLEKSPTDFNDLHVLEGLEIVREQLNG